MQINLAVCYHPVACGEIRLNGEIIDSAHRLRLVRGMQNRVSLRFVTGSGAADPAVAATDFVKSYAAVAAGGQLLALTETGISAVAGTSGTELTVDDLIVNTAAVADREAAPIPDVSADSDAAAVDTSPRCCRAEVEIAGFTSLDARYPVVRVRIPVEIHPLLYLPPVPVPAELPRFYTKSEVDNLLPSDLSDLSDASDLLGFQPIVALASPSFAPQGARVYTYTLTGGETFAFDASNLPAGRVATFELWLAMPATAVAFTLPSVTWVEGSAPDFSDGSKVYKLAVRSSPGSGWEANLLYTREVTL